jgi:hypothetical protein
MAQVVECLTIICEALGLIAATTKNKTKQNEQAKKVYKSNKTE